MLQTDQRYTQKRPTIITGDHAREHWRSFLEPTYSYIQSENEVDSVIKSRIYSTQKPPNTIPQYDTQRKIQIVKSNIQDDLVHYGEKEIISKQEGKNFDSDMISANRTNKMKKLTYIPPNVS